ncbi:uncharacterized protein G2W53_010978 [Senna tora]|uniref:Uncharacterized protein n=1 Tax=Senna tora TaxID=362788 RepID=A0A834X1A2_9FABA|nr:uncharacterized protein G2W53_010978 [Senna tora]
MGMPQKGGAYQSGAIHNILL